MIFLRSKQNILSNKLFVLLLHGFFLLFTESTVGHHSVVANFDRNSVLEIYGTVLSVEIKNPHSRFTLEVREEDGKSIEWLVEWSDRNSLIRRKVDIDQIKAGDQITLSVWPSYRLNHVGYFVRAKLADGSTFRDCGFREFRQAVVNSTEFNCPEANGSQ
jgi:hypothetical protein